MNELIHKASVLIEALPYIQKFRGETVVIKYGGAAMEDASLVRSALQDIVFLEAVGINPVVVHGGGKAITRKMEEAGLVARFVNGMRVTDEASIRIVEEVLSKQINPGIVQVIDQLGGRPRGLSGREILRAKRIYEREKNTGAQIDIGFVGEITGVNDLPLREAIRRSVIPVVSPIAIGAGGVIFNINADVAAAEVATSLKARKLVFMSDVNGLRRVPKDESTLISSLKVSEVPELISSGVIDGGMMPKVQSAVRALENGVKNVHFIDGRLPHALLLEVFTDKGIGTEIVQ